MINRTVKVQTISDSETGTTASEARHRRGRIFRKKRNIIRDQRARSYRPFEQNADFFDVTKSAGGRLQYG